MAVLLFIGLVLVALEIPSSATGWTILLPLLYVGFPILGAWAFLRPSRAQIRPLLMATGSTLFAVLLFASTVRVIGGERHAVGAMTLPWLVVLPLASVLGAFLASFIRPVRPAGERHW